MGTDGYPRPPRALGTTPTVIAVLDGPILPGVVEELEGLQIWLATVTAQISKQKADAVVAVPKSNNKQEEDDAE